MQSLLAVEASCVQASKQAVSFLSIDTVCCCDTVGCVPRNNLLRKCCRFHLYTTVVVSAVSESHASFHLLRKGASRKSREILSAPVPYRPVMSEVSIARLRSPVCLPARLLRVRRKTN